MKKNRVFWLIVFFLIAIASCQEDEILKVKNFTATEGTRVGNVRLTYNPISEAEDYEFQRKNPETDSWQQIAYIKGWVPDHMYDDRGYCNENSSYILKPRQVYEYRMRAWASGDYSNPWSTVATGYIFAPSPRLVKVKYEADENPDNDGVFTFTIKDPLPDDLSNLISRTITIYRAEAGNLYFDQLYLNNNTIEGIDSTIYVTCNEENNDAPYDYKFEISYYYSYSYTNVLLEGSMLEGRQASYIYQSFIITEDDIDIDDGDTPETVTYNIQNYNEINSSSSGAKDGTIMCEDGSTIYLGYFDNWSGLSGIPAIMKNTGSLWEIAGGTLPSELLSDNSIDEFDFTVSGDIIYLAALSSDTLFVYKYDGSWSANLSTTTLWGTSKPDYLNIAVLSNELYLTIKQEDDIKVFKYTGSEWVQVGSTIASGFYTDTKLKEIEGTLYIWFEGHLNGSTEATLYISHLNGSSWDLDLQWTKDAASDFDIIKAGSDIYFKCSGMSSGFTGGIFEVTSTSTVRSLEGDELKIIPEAITSDASGNIIATIMTVGASASDFQLGVYIYEGSVWKKVNDNFSDVSFHGNSSGVQAMNNDIHFVYGLKSSEDGLGYATILKAKKYSK